MSEYARKHAAAIAELEATDIWRSSYMPPIYHLYRKLGVKARPPHYARFGVNAVGQGVFFGLIWGVLMWFTQWQDLELSALGTICATVLVGVLFGCAMAFAFGRVARKWKLTDWDDL